MIWGVPLMLTAHEARTRTQALTLEVSRKPYGCTHRPITQPEHKRTSSRLWLAFWCHIPIARTRTLSKTLAGAWAGGTEYGVIFFLLNKIVCFVLCVTSFPFVIFPLT